MEKKETYRIMPPAWKELGFRSYDAYIKSRLWWNIRQLVLERDGKCCQVCGSPSKTVHHIDYTQTIMLGQGDQHELITLCEPCHNFVEQNKRISEKKSLLNKLFGQHSKNTLDEWQIWARQFNSDIQYNQERLFEHNNLKRKRHKHKKKPISKPSEILKVIPVPEKESSLSVIKNEIDDYIKQHKKKKKPKAVENKDISNYFKNKDQSWINSKVKYYNNLSEDEIKKQLRQAFPYFINLLFHHPKANQKLKNCISPCFQKDKTKETFEQKRIRLEEQYQKQKAKKKTKLSGKLPTWTTNSKTSIPKQENPLMKYVQKVKSKSD
jgi:5-methylcytosine-specific restriction endonuclease McrA